MGLDRYARKVQAVRGRGICVLVQSAGINGRRNEMVVETKVETVADKKAKVLAEMSYKFRDEAELSEA